MNLFAAVIVTFSLGNSLSHAAITEPQAQEVGQMVEKAMQPILVEQNKNARIRWGGDWSQFSITTTPDHRERAYVITVVPGFYQHPRVTPDIFLLSLCHEYGHVLGGAPYFNHFAEDIQLSKPQSEMARIQELSAEGQADFFATSVCVKKVAEMAPDKWLRANYSVPAQIASGCSAQHHDKVGRSICLFSASVAQELISLLSNPKGDSNRPVPKYLDASFEVASVTAQSFEQYPSVACRLDTMAQGALCLNGQNGCTFAGQPVEMRPACWYAPGSSNIQMARKN